MLSIRAEQMRVLADAAQRGFEDRLLRHIADHFPTHGREVGPQQLRNVIRLGMRNAAEYGLRTQRELYLFVSLMLYLGSYFDSDEQLAWTAALRADASSRDPFGRISATYEAALRYLNRVGGSKGQYHDAAIRRLAGATAGELVVASSEAIAAKLAWLYPEKCAALGPDQQRRLVQLGLAHLDEYGLAVQNGAVSYLGLMLVLGHRVDHDPQFPWLRAMLTASEPADPDSRAAALHATASAQLRRWVA